VSGIQAGRRAGDDRADELLRSDRIRAQHRRRRPASSSGGNAPSRIRLSVPSSSISSSPIVSIRPAPRECSRVTYPSKSCSDRWYGQQDSQGDALKAPPKNDGRQREVADRDAGRAVDEYPARMDQKLRCRAGAAVRCDGAVQRLRAKPGPNKLQTTRSNVSVQQDQGSQSSRCARPARHDYVPCTIAVCTNVGYPGIRLLLRRPDTSQALRSPPHCVWRRLCDRRWPAGYWRGGVNWHGHTITLQHNSITARRGLCMRVQQRTRQ